MGSRSSSARPAQDSAAEISGSRHGPRPKKTGPRRSSRPASIPCSATTCPHSRGMDRPCTSARTARVRRVRSISQRARRSPAGPEEEEEGAPHGAPSHLLQVVLELAAPRGVPQLAQRLRLDLTDALACDVELTAHLFERAGAPVLETETQLQHAPLPAGESLEDRLDLLLEELVRRGIARRQGLVVGDEVPEVRILFLADRRLERDRLLRDLHDLAHLVGGDEHPLCDLLGGRFAAELLKKSTRDADELVDRLDHVDRNADGPRLVRDRTCDRLADPPRRVRGELVALAVVELFDGADETDVPLLDQVEEAHAAADVLLRDRYDESKVRLGQVVASVVALLDELVGETAQRALLVRVELRELVEMLDEDVAQLSAEHDKLAETLSTFGRPVDLRVLRQDPEREALGIAARSVDEGDGLIDEDLRLVADLIAVRFDLQRDAQLGEPVRDARQLF